MPGRRGGDKSTIPLPPRHRQTPVAAEPEDGANVSAGHIASVEDVAYSPDGTLVASLGSEDTIKLWDVAGRKLIRTLRRDVPDSLHPFQRVMFSPDGKTVTVFASYNYDKQEQKPPWSWNVATGEPVPIRINEPRALICSMAYSPDGKTIATGVMVDDPDNPNQRKGMTKLWDVATGKVVKALPHPRLPSSVVFSRDGKTLVTAIDGLPNQMPAEIQFWDLASGTVTKTFVARSIGTWRTRQAQRSSRSFPRPG